MSDTRQRLDRINALIEADMLRMGMVPNVVPSSNPAKTRMDTFNRDLDVEIAKTRREADRIIDAPVVPSPPPAARAPLPALRLGLASDPRASLPIGALPAAPAPVIPIPRARPAPTTYTIQKGDNPSKIANTLGLTLEQLEAKNPGLIKRARRLQIGEKLDI